jgi:hypothetical protein
MGVAVEALGIHIRDTKALSKQATLAGKLIILESNILKTPTIVLDNIELTMTLLQVLPVNSQKTYKN